jgi:hypothetical protein
MTHLPAGEYARQIQDTLATNSGVRDGLKDDEAIPLIDWGVACAEHVAGRLASPNTPAPSEEQVSEAAFSLTRWLTRLNWLVTYRNKKDAAWLTKTFMMVNKLSQDLFGEDATTLSEDEIAAWIEGHAGKSDGELLQGLMARLSPAGIGSAGAAETPGDAEVAAPAADSGIPIAFGALETAGDTAGTIDAAGSVEDAPAAGDIQAAEETGTSAGAEDAERAEDAGNTAGAGNATSAGSESGDGNESDTERRRPFWRKLL